MEETQFITEGYCNETSILGKNGVQQFVITSPRLATAIAREKLIEANDVSAYLKEFGIDLIESTIILHDRDKTSKQLNDRLTIQKIVGGMKWVCPVCLDTVAAWADANEDLDS